MDRFRLYGVLCVILVTGLAGCKSTPKGDSGGRLAPGEVSRAELDGPGITFTDMDEAADSVARRVARRLQEMVQDDFVDPQVRVWVVFGDIVNETGGPRSDIEMIREQMMDKLQDSGMWRYHVKVVATRPQMRELIRRERPSDNDPLQTGESPEGPDRPGRDHFYFLNTRAYGARRGTAEKFYLTFKLVRERDGEELPLGNYGVSYDK